MATSLTPQGGKGGRGWGGNSLAAVVNAAVSSVAAILNSWGRMPAVRTLPEYLGRKLPVLAGFGIAGVLMGGRVGTILAVGALLGLFVDTGVAAWHQRHPRPPGPEKQTTRDEHLQSGGAPAITVAEEARSETGQAADEDQTGAEIVDRRFR